MRDHEIVGRAGRVDELHQGQLCHLTQSLQITHLERLNIRQPVPSFVAVTLERVHENLFHRQADAREIGWMFRLGINTDVPGRGLTELPRVRVTLLLDAVYEGQDLLESWNLELPVEAGIPRPGVRNALARAQCFELGECEVFGEPSGHRAAIDDLRSAPGCELRMLGHVSGTADLVFVARDEHAVFGHDEIGLDVVGTVLDGNEIRRERVLRHITARAAMSYDYGSRLMLGIAGLHCAARHEYPDDNGGETARNTQYRHGTC